MRRVVVAALLAAAAAGACGRQMQSPECARYLACAEAVDATRYRSVNGQYGPNGTCWNTNQATADACTMVCTREREVLLGMEDAGFDKPECQ